MNIEDLKLEVPVLEVLAYYGADTGRRWGGGGWSGWTPINCPFCTDSNGSASVNVAAGYFRCHQCGAPERANDKAGDIIDIVKFAEGFKTTEEAVQWIRGKLL